MKRFARLFRLSCAALLAAALSPLRAAACACGCGVFDVGTSAMLPNDSGGLAFVEFDSVDQDRNWSGTRRAPADANEDRRLRSSFFTAGVHYMMSRRWGVMAEVPYWTRHFEAADEDSGDVSTFHQASVGDVRLRGVFAGFSSDMSTGLTFGLKLPTGGFHDPHFDRDTAIGTGSTDVLLGLYHFGRLPLDAFDWFGSAQIDAPALTAGGYRPGAEANAVVGSYYDGFRPAGVRLAPMAQLTGSWRGRDGGPQANTLGSGYERLLAGPGLEAGFGAVRVDATAGFPIYQRVIGDQLVARQYYKVSLGYAF